MNVFVTGGTRALGQPTVRLLVERGHAVRGLSRSEEGDQTLRALGAEPVRADLFDPASLPAAMDDAEAVLHLATHIPPASTMADPGAWAMNDRLRVEGTRNLADFALAAGAHVFVYPSIALVYPDRGAEWIDATTTAPAADGSTITTLEAEQDVARFATGGGRGVSLRMGWFYGPASSQTRATLEAARQGMALVSGRGDAYQSSIWIDDAASAVVAAMERAPSGVYDVVEDEPLPKRDIVSAIAAGLGYAHLQAIPDAASRQAIGESLFATANRSQRVSNRRFKEATGWSPRVSSAREGWRLLGESALAGAAR